MTEQHTPGPLVRLPSGKTCGAEIVGEHTLLHKWGCECDRCEPELAAKRERVRDAAPELLAALRAVKELDDCAEDGVLNMPTRAAVRAAIATADGNSRSLPARNELERESGRRNGE